jgi:uncharacterized protein YjbJ (UPF0337 family)
MNKDIFEGRWKQVKGEAKAWWGKLTDDDLDRAAGKIDVLAGLLQEKYGYTRERAVDEIDKRVTEYEFRMKSKTEPSTRYLTGQNHCSYSSEEEQASINLHDNPCKSDNSIGEKNEYLNLLGSCCSHRLGGKRNHEGPGEPVDQYCCGRRGCFPGWLLPQPHIRSRDDQ